MLCGSSQLLQISPSEPHGCGQQLWPLWPRLEAPSLREVREGSEWGTVLRGQAPRAASLHTGTKPKIQSPKSLGGGWRPSRTRGHAREARKGWRQSTQPPHEAPVLHQPPGLVSRSPDQGQSGLAAPGQPRHAVSAPGDDGLQPPGLRRGRPLHEVTPIP